MHDSDKDRNAFADATRDVRPIEDDDRVPRISAKPKPKARHSRAARLTPIDESLNSRWHEAASGEVEFHQRQISRRTLRGLRDCRFAIEAEIDLHGMSRTEAQSQLRDFILGCIERRIGCVRVIHGKGARSGPDGPVLKNSVRQWLTRWEEVLAYTSAQPKHGGTGAIYVLLGRR